MGPDARGPLHPCLARGRESAAFGGSRAADAGPARHVRRHRSAAHAGGDQGLPGGSRRGRVREACRAAAREPALRRALGPPLDGRHPLRRHERLGARRAPDPDLALSRLLDPLVQRGQIVLPIRGRADRRRRDPARRPRCAHRHRLPAAGTLRQHRLDLHGGGQEPERADDGPRQYDGVGLPRSDGSLCQLPRPQIRPDLTGGPLPSARILRGREAGRRHDPRFEGRARADPEA